ncbi:PEP-CTERM sorting domain-containing protein [Kiritimatiellaeota bacterium B1221]|nr:PEP-CTERM sorting domain-containing protein [Kiritimatiellaeota bacterium B1221]
MKNLSAFLTALTLCAVLWASNTPAAIVSFAEWDSAGIVHNSSTSQSAVATQDGLTFTLSISSVGGSAGNISNLTGGVGNRLGVYGGKDNGAIDQGSGNVGAPGNDADDEALKFTLSVSGGSLASLELQSITLLQWGVNERLTFNDGSSDFDYLSASTDESFNYTGTAVNAALTGLIPLSIANVGGLGDGSWEMTLYAREKLAGGSTTSTSFGVDEISFAYAIPEPSSLWLLLMAGISGLCFHRKNYRGMPRGKYSR